MHVVTGAMIGVLAFAEGGSKEFILKDTPRDERGEPSALKPTLTEAAIKFTVVDKTKGPVKGIVISLASAEGKKYYTDETDAEGKAALLVPNAQKYEVVFLSLGQRDIATTVNVTDEPRQTIRLTLRYKGYDVPKFVLAGVTFETGKAILRAESFPRLESIVEYLKFKKRSRIEISGHTDNVGNAKLNKTLSLKRAQACRDYLVTKGIEGSRIETVGHGAEMPAVPNDTPENREKNRRIEAREL
jgi:outer membrane protein OmpA-like peptidoglycan-associated protein